MTWRALFARLWAVIVQRFTPLAPDCIDCGMPCERVKSHDKRAMRLGIFVMRKEWGVDGRCFECTQIFVDSERIRLEAKAAALETQKAENARNYQIERAKLMIEAPHSERVVGMSAGAQLAMKAALERWPDHCVTWGRPMTFENVHFESEGRYIGASNPILLHAGGWSNTAESLEQEKTAYSAARASVLAHAALTADIARRRAAAEAEAREIDEPMPTTDAERNWLRSHPRPSDIVDSVEPGPDYVAWLVANGIKR